MSGKRGGGGGGGEGRKLTYREKAGISFVEQAEPDFIKKLKSQAGYKEPAKIEDKFRDSQADEDDDVPETTEGELLHTKEEERPQVVVLNPETDLTSEELKKALDEQKNREDEQKIADGKITFKKPVKRGADGKEIKEEEDREAKRKRAMEPEKKIENRLLSFGDDEEDDE